MPHITLEYSSNILEKNNLKPLFSSIHQILTEALPTKLEACKSRAIKYEEFYLADGSENNAFLHLNIKVMKGRSVELINSIALKITSLLKEYFSKSSKALNLQITLEMDELQPTYYKD